MSHILFQAKDHLCVMFSETTFEHGSAVQSNQFVIVHKHEAAILEPGGSLGFNETLLAVRGHTPMHAIRYILASHADPDVIGGLDRWLSSAPHAQLVLPSIWARFAPHFTKGGKSDGRIFGVPDEGGRLLLGGGEIWILPAHFLHSEGNIQFYDPTSKILFSGDLGASLVRGDSVAQYVTDFESHVPHMEAFHRRYMVSSKVLKMWVRMVRELDLQMIVPQHGIPLVGAAIPAFLSWLDQLACGIDLLGQQAYRIPHARLAIPAYQP